MPISVMLGAVPIANSDLRFEIAAEDLRQLPCQLPPQGIHEDVGDPACVPAETPAPQSDHKISVCRDMAGECETFGTPGSDKLLRERSGNLLMPAPRGMDKMLHFRGGVRKRKLQTAGAPFQSAVQRVQFGPVGVACVLIDRARPA